MMAITGAERRRGWKGSEARDNAADAGLRVHDSSAVQRIADFFEQVRFGYVLTATAGGSSRLFAANFSFVQDQLQSLSTFYRMLFSLFVQGHVVDDRYVRVIPRDVLDAFLETGLVTCDGSGRWRTPRLCIVWIDGLYCAVSLPTHYPTARGRTQRIYFGAEHAVVKESYPSRMADLRVLDLGPGSGIQGLLCAKRGAREVVCVESDEVARAATRFNAALNKLGDRVLVTDALDDARDAGTFDLVVSAPPSMPMSDAIGFNEWGAAGADGARYLAAILEQAPRYLAPKGEALVFCRALGGASSINVNQSLLDGLARRYSCTIHAYVHEKLAIAEYLQRWQGLIDRYFRLAERQPLIDQWSAELRQTEVPADYFYTQLVRIQHTDEVPKFSYIPTYPLVATDPLRRAVRPGA